MDDNLNLPTPHPSKKKKMTPLKWMIILLPICIVLLCQLTFFAIKGIDNFINDKFNEITETEQYKMAIEYLKESNIFLEVEPNEDAAVKMNGWYFSTGTDGKKYEFTFKTENTTYIIVIRDNGDGLFVSEEECHYNQSFAD